VVGSISRKWRGFIEIHVVCRGRHRGSSIAQENARKEIETIMKRLLLFSLAALLTASTLSAGTLHSDDPKYRGAFTLLTAGLVQGGRAQYWTEIKILNDSDHAIPAVRFELYPTTGPYKEWVDDANKLAAFPDSLGATGYGWGMIMVPGSPDGTNPILVPGGWLAQQLGTSDMGTLRIVALNADGSDDMTAVISGSGRVVTAPNSGGRMWMDEPGLSDYELVANDFHIARNFLWDPSLVVRYRAFNPVSVFQFGDPGVQELLGLVNFDRTRTAKFTIGSQKATDPFGATCELPSVDVEVPAGQSRRVVMQHCGGQFARALTTVTIEPGAGPFATYQMFVDKTTGAAQINYDWVTDILLLRRTH
jgi:hypothetical protein